MVWYQCSQIIFSQKWFVGLVQFLRKIIRREYKVTRINRAKTTSIVSTSLEYFFVA
jgi:hypothetical protein